MLMSPSRAGQSVLQHWWFIEQQLTAAESPSHICQHWKCLVSTITANKLSDILTGLERKQLEDYFYNLLTVWRDVLSKSSSFLNERISIVSISYHNKLNAFGFLITPKTKWATRKSGLQALETSDRHAFSFSESLKTKWVLVSSESWRWSMAAAINNITVHIS